MLIDSAAENGLYRRISNAEFLIGTGGTECRLVDDRHLTQKAELPAFIKFGLPSGPQQQRPSISLSGRPGGRLVKESRLNAPLRTG